MRGISAFCVLTCWFLLQITYKQVHDTKPSRTQRVEVHLYDPDIFDSNYARTGINESSGMELHFLDFHFRLEFLAEPTKACQQNVFVLTTAYSSFLDLTGRQVGLFIFLQTLIIEATTLLK